MNGEKRTQYSILVVWQFGWARFIRYISPGKENDGRLERSGRRRESMIIQRKKTKEYLYKADGYLHFLEQIITSHSRHTVVCNYQIHLHFLLIPQKSEENFKTKGKI